VIRIVLESGLRLPLAPLLHLVISSALFDVDFSREAKRVQIIDSLEQLGFAAGPVAQDIREAFYSSDKRGLYFETSESPEAAVTDLLAFFADRLKVYLREKGARHDLIDAVFALPGQDDLLMIVRRVEALGKLLETEDGKNLLAGYRRAANILRAEEKKDGAEAFAGEYVQTELVPAAERYLADVVASAGAAVRQHVDAEDFEGAMRALATLRSPVDGFFLDVTVNDPDPRTRLNRLRLLNELREAMHAVADFSKVAG
jgi:glycyl-tRNA synthetase beta chain